jgi:hypothetical protein
LMGTFGQSGNRIGEFSAPGGLWVDASNRIYIADTANARVQVYQISAGTTSPTLARTTAVIGPGPDR